VEGPVEDGEEPEEDEIVNAEDDVEGSRLREIVRYDEVWPRFIQFHGRCM